MITFSKSEQELRRIKNLSAFNIANAARKKVNQHLTMYTFSDDSILKIYTSRQIGVALCKTGAHFACENILVNSIGA